MNFSGLLLAGGKSSRFQSNKIKILSYGIPILADQIIKLCFFCEEVIICTSRENQGFTEETVKKIGYYTRVLGISGKIEMPLMKIIPDENILEEGVRSIGPLAGIYAGLRNSINDRCIVVASDMPFISFRLLEIVKNTARENPGCDSVIIKSEKGIEALCGVYSKKYIKIIEDNIKDCNYRISDVLDALEVKWLDSRILNAAGIDMYNFFNINSKKDIAKFKEILNKEVEGYDPGNLSGGTIKKWKDNFFRGSCKGTK
jgi:molybdopterin-guanine dinucleotide biosynthesis protein A